MPQASSAVPLTAPPDFLCCCRREAPGLLGRPADGAPGFLGYRRRGAPSLFGCLSKTGQGILTLTLLGEPQTKGRSRVG